MSNQNGVGTIWGQIVPGPMVRGSGYATIPDTNLYLPQDNEVLPYDPIDTPSKTSDDPYQTPPIIDQGRVLDPALNPVVVTPVTTPATNTHPIIPGSYESKLPGFLQGDLTFGTIAIPKVLAAGIALAAIIYLISKGK